MFFFMSGLFSRPGYLFINLMFINLLLTCLTYGNCLLQTNNMNAKSICQQSTLMYAASIHYWTFIRLRPNQVDSRVYT